MKIAIITPVWPSYNETAILNQIIELKKNGYNDLFFFTFKTNEKESTLIPSQFIDKSLTKKVLYLKQPDLQIVKNRFFTKISLTVKSLPHLFRTLYYSPKIFFKALFKKEYGEYRKAFKIIYLVQNLLGHKFYFDIIHCHYAPNGIWGAILKDLGLINGHLVTTFHGYGINKLPKSKPSDFYRFLISQSSFFTANSNFTKLNAVKIGFPLDKIFIIRVSLNVSEYTFKERHYHKSETFKVLTVAALRNVKGIEYSIKAIKELLNKNPDIKILYQIAGEGYLKNKLIDLINELKLNDYVKLLGFIKHDELKKLYDDSHIFILSSITTKTGNQEAQGLVFQEAQACGLPVIGTNTGGIPEGIMDGKSGFIIPEKDTLAIAEKIAYFYFNPEKIAEFGKTGRAFVTRNFDINTETKKLIKQYKNIIFPNKNSPNIEKNT